VPDLSAPLSPRPQSERKLTGFYVVVGVAVVLGLFGLWFWRTWTVWWFDADEARRRQGVAAQQLFLPIEESVELGSGITLDLVLIPAGRFKMGSPADEKGRNRADELQHWVVITRPFYIGKYEVTQEQWEKVMGNNPSGFKGPKNPVGGMMRHACEEFLKKLDDLAKEKGSFRLPTEAEWEWACRAGTRTRFCCGDDEGALVDYAWFYDNSGRVTHPVGTKKPNAWGLFDMHGNVWEWCGDSYGEDYYAKSPRYDPTGRTTGAHFVGLKYEGDCWVLRGGESGTGLQYCRSSERYYCALMGGGDDVGFRVVLVPAGH
jgi:formylglycine-generating enzyme required for sulfatase activity